MTDKKKDKEFTEMQRVFLIALFGEAEGDFRAAARLAGYSETTTIKEIIEPLKEEILNNAQSSLVSLAPKAVAKMKGLLDDPNKPGAPNQIKVIESILTRVGLNEKSDKDVNLKVPSGGIFILPAKRVQEFKREGSEGTLVFDASDFDTDEDIDVEDTDENDKDE